MNTLGSLVVLALALQQGASQKPVLIVGKDGFPSGHASPEGVACDLARAFINCDPALFRDTCLKSFGGGDAATNYQAFLDQMADSMKAEKQKAIKSPGGPKSIEKVFAVRKLTKDGPESYAQAVFNFKSLRFVDVVVRLLGGRSVSNRTMVLQDKSGKWFVHPYPTMSPILSQGLNQETDSKVEVSSAYRLKAK